jgi:hypothetical protein
MEPTTAAGVKTTLREEKILRRNSNRITRTRNSVRMKFRSDPSPFYLLAFLIFAHLAFWAAAILARASGESRRFFRPAAAALVSWWPSLPARIARTCSSF